MTLLTPRPRSLTRRTNVSQHTATIVDTKTPGSDHPTRGAGDPPVERATRRIVRLMRRADGRLMVMLPPDTHDSSPTPAQALAGADDTVEKDKQ